LAVVAKDAAAYVGKLGGVRHYLLGSTYLQTGQGNEAVTQMQLARELDDSGLTTMGLAQAYAVSGATVKAKKLMADVHSRAGEKRAYVAPYDEAGVYLRLGDLDRAMSMLEKAFEDRSTWRIFLAVEPKFDELRDHERFAQLLNKMTRLANLK
jgi:tetratricopeptide (TPR) repeat protein